MATEAHLVWSPVVEGLCGYSKGRRVVLAIAPFVQCAAMEQLLGGLTWADNATVLTRWRSADVVSGVSDIEVYPLLRRKGIRMMVNDALHMKMLVFDDGTGFVTSANITGSGLGLNHASNIEVGMEVSLGSHDASRLALLLADSRIVTDQVYIRVKLYLADHQQPPEPLPSLDLSDAPPAHNGGLALPLVGDPQTLWQIYSGLKVKEASGAAGLFDQGLKAIVVLNIPGGLTRTEFDLHLRKTLESNPIVQDITKALKYKGSLCFGQVVSQMQRSAHDNHAIGRRELKSYARSLYDWLPWLNQNIYWDRPRHSMVLRLLGRQDET